MTTETRGQKPLPHFTRTPCPISPAGPSLLLEARAPAPDNLGRFCIRRITVPGNLGHFCIRCVVERRLSGNLKIYATEQLAGFKKSPYDGRRFRQLRNEGEGFKDSMQEELENDLAFVGKTEIKSSYFWIG